MTAVGGPLAGPDDSVLSQVWEPRPHISEKALLPGEALILPLVATSKSVHSSLDPQDLFTALQKRACTHGRILTVVRGTSCGVQKEQGGAMTAFAGDLIPSPVSFFIVSACLMSGF